MKILMIYPQYPDSYWSFRHALRFVSKKAAFPPLGLITVSAMLPAEWEKKLVDMNVSVLHENDILWADYVFLSAMHIQQESAGRVIEQCRKLGVKMVAGGPLFTQDFQRYPEIDHFVLNEAEITLPPFLEAIKNGRTPEKIYKTAEFADLSLTPPPDFHLLNRKVYASMNIQVSRGCPHACDFCEVTSLLGHKVRMKSPAQVLRELDGLYENKWRGHVFIVDDNFIGNKKEIKNNLLPAMKEWMQRHHHPFSFSTETTIMLADDPELMSLMTETGFRSTFIGIETPDEKCLSECNKVQNKNRDLVQSVKKIQRSGMQVTGGFIVGFDSDTPGVFRQQIDFIQQSGIVSAMVGLLSAPRNTKLYNRLKAENRLTIDRTGNNTDFSLNFVPRMNVDELIDGYKSIIHNIYSVKPYYQRIRAFLKNYKGKRTKAVRVEFAHIKAFMRSIFIIGIMNKGRLEYWKLFFWTLFKRPALFPDAMTLAVYGYHYRATYGLK